MGEWATVVPRIGALPRDRDQRFEEYVRRYGRENCRLAWITGRSIAGFSGLCILFEDAYFNFLKDSPVICTELINQASEICSEPPPHIAWDLEYSNHMREVDLLVVALRRVLIRLGLWFQGEEKVKITLGEGGHPFLSVVLSPGKVPFHRPDLIQKPEILGREWGRGTVESFFWSNQVLQVKFKSLFGGMMYDNTGPSAA